MALIIQKFGGTSVADLERLQNVASIVARARAQGHFVVVVVSAMAGVTNQLLSHIKGAYQSAENAASNQENDVVLAAGEQVTAGLLSLCLQDIGISAQSFLSWQVPIHTDDCFTNASIKNVHPDTLRDALNKGLVPVVAGFQGIHNNRITTLGRGGSDLTAVAIAHALKADFCDIYTDVAGVYTADPRIIGNARKIDKITFEEMLELATHGAKVLQDKCVAYAHNHGVRLRVFSSFHDEGGTEIADKVSFSNDNNGGGICGIAHSFQVARIALTGEQLDVCRVRRTLSEKSILVDGLTHFRGVRESIQLGITKADVVHTLSAIKSMSLVDANPVAQSFQDVEVDTNVCKVTVVGKGIDCGSIPSHILKALNSRRIFAEVVGLTHLKMTLYIKEEKATETIRLLHDTLNLHSEFARTA